MSNKLHADVGEMLFGALIVGLGLFIGIENAMSGDAAGNVAVGPKVFPYLIAAGLLSVGLANLAGAFRHTPTPRDELDWLPVGLVLAAMLAPIAMLATFGWIPAATVLFTFGARAFGSTSWIKAVAIGLGLSAATFTIFNIVLGLSLPVGSLFESMP